MAVPQDPLQRCIFYPLPREFLDDDSAFPVGTVATVSNDSDLENIFTKQEGGLWRADITESEPGLILSNAQLDGRQFGVGVIATIFDAGSGTAVEYVKTAEGIWRLARQTTEAAPADLPGPGAGPDAEDLPQAKFSAQTPPNVPDVQYGSLRLSQILEDGGASVAQAESAAYDGEKVKGQKLSLRLLFPRTPYSRPQFNVRFGNEKRVITRRHLAVHIAKEVKRTLVLADTEGDVATVHRADGTTENIPFDKLVLKSVAFPSKGSIQPTIGVLRK